MSLSRYVRRTPSVAVFARNHEMYLEDAAEKEPGELTTFRSSAAWKSAELAVEHHGPRTIYFTLVGDEEGKVRYEAVLEHVLLVDESSDEEIKSALSHELEATRGEGLWGKTLYVIRNCREIEEPFPFTELKKLEDGIGLSEGFRYSYALVVEREEASVE